MGANWTEFHFLYPKSRQENCLLDSQMQAGSTNQTLTVINRDISVFLLFLPNNPAAYLIEITISSLLPSPPGLERCLDPFAEGSLDILAEVSFWKKKTHKIKSPEIYITVDLKFKSLYLKFTSLCCFFKCDTEQILTQELILTFLLSLFPSKPVDIFSWL